MRLKDIITESYLSELISGVQDILTSISAQDIESIKVTDFQKLLMKQGFTTSEPEVIQAIEQSGFATVDGDEETITISAGSKDNEFSDDIIPPEEMGADGSEEGLGGGGGLGGGLGGGPGGELGGEYGEGPEGELGGIGDEFGDMEGNPELGDDGQATGGGIVDDEDLPENQPPEENQNNDIFGRASRNNLQKMKSRI